jgi:hypothetical protein
MYTFNLSQEKENNETSTDAPVHLGLRDGTRHASDASAR